MKSELTRRAGRYIDPGDHRYSPRVAGAVEFFGVFLNRGWGPVSPVCDGTTPHWLVSLYHPPIRVEGPLWSSNQSAILANGTRVSTPWGAVSTRENSVFFPHLSNFHIYIWNDPWTGGGTLSSSGRGLAQQYTNPSQLEIGRLVALEISTLCGEVSILVISVFVPGLSELYVCERIMIRGMDPIVPR